MVAALFVQDRVAGSNVFLHVRPPLSFQQGLLLSQAFAAEMFDKQLSAPKDTVVLLNLYTAHYNVVGEMFIVGIPQLQEHAMNALELIRAVKNLLVQSCEGIPKVNTGNLQKRFTELFLCIDEMVYAGHYPLSADCKEQMMGRKLTAAEPFNLYGEGCRILNIASSNNEIKDSIARHATVAGFEFSYTDQPVESLDCGLLTTSFLTTADGQRGPYVPIRVRNDRSTDGASPFPGSPVTAIPVVAPVFESRGSSGSSTPETSPRQESTAESPPASALPEVTSIPEPPPPLSVPPQPEAPHATTPHSLDASIGSNEDIFGSPLSPFSENGSQQTNPKHTPASFRSAEDLHPESHQPEKVILPFKVMVQETITAHYDAVAASLTSYSLVGDLLVHPGKHVVPLSQAGNYPDHTECSFFVKMGNCDGRIDQARANPAFAKDLGGFKFRCDLAIVNNAPTLPATPVAVVRYKTAPGFCPVPIRLKYEWSTVQEPAMVPSDDPFEDAMYVSTDQLVLQWMVNPATPLTSLSFLINPNTEVASAMNQQSKPPGAWNNDQRKLMWTAISDNETLPNQLLARFKMRSAVNESGAKAVRQNPIAARLEGRRNRPLTDVTFTFGALQPGVEHPIPAEVKGGIMGKYISNSYTFS